MTIFEMIENEAIELFGEEKAGTREKRIAMTKEEKIEMLEFMFRRFGDITGIYVRIFV